MRKCLALFSALAFFASPFFFAYLEAERLLGSPDAVYRWSDPWLPLATIWMASLVPIFLPWLVDMLADQTDPPSPSSITRQEK